MLKYTRKLFDGAQAASANGTPFQPNWYSQTNRTVKFEALITPDVTTVNVSIQGRMEGSGNWYTIGTWTQASFAAVTSAAGAPGAVGKVLSAEVRAFPHMRVAYNGLAGAPLTGGLSVWVHA
jgi:hypothetical protein